MSAIGWCERSVKRRVSHQRGVAVDCENEASVTRRVSHQRGVAVDCDGEGRMNSKRRRFSKYVDEESLEAKQSWTDPVSVRTIEMGFEHLSLNEDILMDSICTSFARLSLSVREKRKIRLLRREMDMMDLNSIPSVLGKRKLANQSPCGFLALYGDENASMVSQQQQEAPNRKRKSAPTVIRR